GQRTDLSDFDKGHIVMASRLGQSISISTALVVCSRSAVVSTYQKWSKEGKAVNRQHGHGQPRLIDARGERRLARVVRSNRRATVPQIAEKVNAGSDRQEALPPHSRSQGYGLRRRERLSYTEAPDLRDEDYLFCEECQFPFLEECEVHGRPVFVSDTPAALGSEKGLGSLCPRSSIPGAGRGVFNQGALIPRGVHYGPYKGQLSTKEAVASGFSRVVSLTDICTGAQFVNCARDEDEQNLVAFQYRGQVYYRSFRPIGPSARAASCSFGVPICSQVFPCSQCSLVFTAQLFLHRHIKRCHQQEYLTLLRSGSITTDRFRPQRRQQHPGPSSAPSPALPPTDNRGCHHRTQCGKIFTSGVLKRHQCTHSGKRPYGCTQCGKSFNTLATFTVHQRTHTGERPYCSAQCGKSCITSGNFKRHQCTHC
ncbi:PRDM9 methyltransferase, partial [Amia calva]|nr:PRDM9 methyltransferase [Amia calva]